MEFLAAFYSSFFFCFWLSGLILDSHKVNVSGSSSLVSPSYFCFCYVEPHYFLASFHRTAYHTCFSLHSLSIETPRVLKIFLFFFSFFSAVIPTPFVYF